jgi:hypothetical protein
MNNEIVHGKAVTDKLISSSPRYHGHILTALDMIRSEARRNNDSPLVTSSTVLAPSWPQRRALKATMGSHIFSRMSVKQRVRSTDRLLNVVTDPHLPAVMVSSTALGT